MAAAGNHCVANLHRQVGHDSMDLFADLETLDIARTLTGARGVLEGEASGQVPSIVNPTGNKKASFIVDHDAHDSPAAFEQSAAAHEGTGWPHLGQWLAARCDAAKRAPRAGSRHHPPLCEAPGTCVMARGQWRRTPHPR
jgi:polyhydroxyalkanoate synthase